MKKSFLFGSVIVAIALFSGCGGSGGSSDTNPPVFTNSTYSFTVKAGVDKTVPLTATDETTVSFSTDSAGAKIEGSNLVFTAPNFNSSSENSYTVNVVAKDKAGNSVTKAFTFDVKATIAKSYKLKPDYIADIDSVNKSFTPEGGYLEDPSGLLWDDTVSAKMTYAAADSYCKAKGSGWRIPTRAEFLNIIDYSKVSSSGSLIDSDFSNYSATSVEVSWVENLTSDKYVVNHTGGDDTIPSNDANHTVLCVYGDKNATAHTFTNVADGVKDNVTGLTWKVINANNRTLNNYGTYSVATSGCTGNWKLPTINQLRSIIDYKTNTIPNIAMGTPDQHTYFIWSNTQGKDSNNGNHKHYIIYLDGIITKAGVMHDEDNNTHYYTCVK